MDFTPYNTSIELADIMLKDADKPSLLKFDEKKASQKASDDPAPTIQKFPISVLFPAEDERIALELPQDPELLEKALADELEDIYIMYGREGLKAFGDTISKLEDQPYALPYQVITYRAYINQANEIDKRVYEVCQALQEKAVSIAVERLDSSIEEIVREAVRYMDVSDSSENIAELLGDKTGKWDFKRTTADGEAEALIKALLELRRLRGELQSALDTKENLKNKLIAGGDMDVRAGYLEHGSEEMLFRKHPELGQLQSGINSLNKEYTEKFIRYCLLYPIIHKINLSKNLPSYPKGATLFLSVPAEQAPLFTAFKREVYDALSKAWNSATGLKESILDDPDEVWLYRPVIEDAVGKLEDYDKQFVERAAEEKMKETGVKEIVDMASILAGCAEVAAVIASPAPPVAAAIAAVSFILGSASLVLEGYDMFRLERAFDSTLDPAKSLGADQSWAMFVVLSVIQAAGIKSVQWKKGAEVFKLL